jgi:hypothetical protein
VLRHAVELYGLLILSDIVIFLGDMMDGGRVDMSDDECVLSA